MSIYHNYLALRRVFRVQATASRRAVRAGTGGFHVHNTDTGTDATESVVEELSPDTWHEFTVVALTSAGVGVASQPSRPVLTEPAPRLLRELRAATSHLAGQKAKLQQKRSELLVLARSSTMALPAV